MGNQVDLNDENKEVNGVFSKIKNKLTPKRTATAYDAYLLATYGVIESKEKRLETFYDSIDSLIYAKSQAGQYCCATEVPDELVKDYLNPVIKKYETMGYTVIDLNGKLESVKRHYIFITWDNKF